MGGEGEDMIKTARPAGQQHPALIDIQERGEIFFFYRPKVDRQEAHSPDDVQRMYIILRPLLSNQGNDTGEEDHPHPPTESGDGCLQQQPLFRLLVMGKKSLPDPSRQGRSRPFWGFVDMVTTNPDDIKAALRGGEEYDTTAKKGHRRNSPARAFGEGVYRILKHEGKRKGKVHTHLVYKLELPSENEDNYEPQESLNVEREASFLIQIKNPAASAPRGAGLEKKRSAVFPAHLQGEFGQLRFRPADPPDFLNYEGCEFLLISASDDIEEELGLELRTTEDQKAAAAYDDASCSDLLKPFGDTAVVAEPLLKGTWV